MEILRFAQAEVENESQDEEGAAIEVKKKKMLFLQLALVTEQRAKILGLRPSTELWPCCGPQYDTTKRRVVLH